MKLILAVSALVAAVVAQDIGSIPQCGQDCINGMINQANTNLGCSNGDKACYCANQAFARGLSDCSGQACGADVQSQVVAYGTQYCASAGGSGGSSASSAASSVSASASSALSSASSSASGAVSSIASSISGAASSASASASSAGAKASSGASSAASGASSAAGSATSSGSGAFKTAAPVAGALGMAALLMI